MHRPCVHAQMGCRHARTSYTIHDRPLLTCALLTSPWNGPWIWILTCGYDLWTWISSCLVTWIVSCPVTLTSSYPWIWIWTASCPSPAPSLYGPCMMHRDHMGLLCGHRMQRMCRGMALCMAHHGTSIHSASTMGAWQLSQRLVKCWWSYTVLLSNSCDVCTCSCCGSCVFPTSWTCCVHLFLSLAPYLFAVVYHRRVRDLC